MQNKLSKVEDFEEWLKGESVEYKLFRHEKACNMEEMKKVVKPEKAPYIKNLFYKLKKGGFGILVALDDTDIKKAFWKEINMSHNHVRMGEEKDLLETINCYKGCVNPLSLVNDKEGKVSLFIMDQKLKEVDYYAFHPGDNSATVELKREDFEALMKKNGKTPLYLNLEADEVAAPAKDDKKKGGKGGKKDAKNAEEDEEGTKLKIIAKKEEDFSEWYQEIITKAELIQNYDVSGCFILRPNAYFIWEQVQEYLNAKFKELNVKNTYFPMFVSQDKLEAEKDHIEGFAPEVAWVTKSGDSDLAKPIAIRPTSETIMYPIFSKWIRSHRDLPLLLNQWSNVVRWEFKHPTPFIRTREFLWQEGHTAHAEREEADELARNILDRYADSYKELYAIPVVKGRKSENEKFAGGDITYTCEAYNYFNGRSIQACTSHLLGQNFAKMFNIGFQDKNMKRSLVWQTSWGYTTRSIGIFLMIHSDNKGAVFTPAIAETQVVIIPIFFKNRLEEIKSKSEELYASLKKAGIRVEIDDRENYTPGFRIATWELRGTPIRLEIGPKDLDNQEVKMVRRVDGISRQVKTEGLVDTLKEEFKAVQESMYENACTKVKESQVTADNFQDFMKHLNDKKMILTPWCDCPNCEKKVKDLSGLLSKQDDQEMSGAAKTLCKPLDQEAVPAGTKCFAFEHCGKEAKVYCYWGRSY